MNEFDKAQAGAELAIFVGKALVDIVNGVDASLKYGYDPREIKAKDAKEIMDAVNNAAQIFSNNENDKKLCEALTILAKEYFDSSEQRR